MTARQFGPGLNGWPAHGYTKVAGPTTKQHCYCGWEFPYLMALNQHVWDEAAAAIVERIREQVEGLPVVTVRPRSSAVGHLVNLAEVLAILDTAGPAE